MVWRLHSSIRCSLSRVFTPSPNSEPSGSTTAARPPGFKQADDEGEEQVGRLPRAEMLREVRLDAVLLASAEGRIGEHDVHAVRLRVADVGPRQRVVVAHEARVLDAVQQHVGDAEHVGKLLLLDRAQGGLHLLLVFRPLHIALAHVIDSAGEKAAGAAGGIEQDFAGVRVDPIHHEGGDGARRVVFARIARRLQVVENLLVDVAEVLPLGQIVEIDAVDLVDHLPHQLAGFHVVVGVLEHVADHATAVTGLVRWAQILQRRE